MLNQEVAVNVFHCDGDRAEDFDKVTRAAAGKYFFVSLSLEIGGLKVAHQTVHSGCTGAYRSGKC